MAKRNKRRRVDPTRVRENAKEGVRTGVIWFRPGVETWTPTKEGKYSIDVVPYEVTDENHPDNVQPGYLWYKRQFSVHRNVGPAQASLVCPVSIQKKCPICEERQRLAKKGADKKELEPYNSQNIVAMNILDPEDPSRTKVFAMSYGKFMGADAGLQTELEQGDDDILNFFDVTGGKTLKTRFSEDSFMGNKFLKCTKCDFKDRDDLDEDEVLGMVTNLDEALVVYDYEKLKTLFFQGAEESADDEEEEEERPRKGKGKARKDDDEEDEDFELPAEEDDDEEDEDDEEERPRKKKKKGKARKDDDDDDSEDDD